MEYNTPLPSMQSNNIEYSMQDNPYTLPARYSNDPHQSEVISIDNGYHLVLAPPGCGKTDILAERVVRALSRGVALNDMLCLTFTNRAARGMRQRIADRLNTNVDNELFVGNVHRFCSQFLYNEGIIPMTTAILDENDMISILQNIIGEDEAEVKDFELRQRFADIAAMQHTAYQYRHGHANELLLNTHIFKKYDIRRFMIHAGYQYSKADILNVYDDIVSITSSENLPGVVYDTTRLFLYAKKYEEYKRINHLIDFDDLLLYTYDYAQKHADSIRRYKWIQIDEVQDLSVMQFAIVDCFTDIANNESVTLYLGDEQQAIFSFIGAKLSTLQTLKERCNGHVHRLYNNYRSPKYLLDVFNTYANMELDVDNDLLPITTNDMQPSQDDLCIKAKLDKNEEVEMVVETAMEYLRENPDERVAVLVPWNKDADLISNAFMRKNVRHFKISGVDLFSTPAVQLLFSHLNIINFEANHFAWAKVLQLIGVFPKGIDARRFMSNMSRSCVTPTDFFQTDGMSYMLWFSEMCKREYVIFDTETTGLDVFHDDIVQIAAIKVKDGEITDTLNIIMHTGRTIPPMLGDVVNPLVEEYSKANRMGRKEGLEKFLSFVDGLPLLGHNVEFDYHILDFNLRRECGIDNIAEICPVYFDSLKVIRIVVPNLKAYKLKYLLSVLHLEGSNSHLADDDIVATKSVVDYCYTKFGEYINRHKRFLENNRKIMDEIRHKYSAFYYHTKDRLYTIGHKGNDPVMVDELKYLYREMVERRWIEGNSKIEYIFNYLTMDVIIEDATPTLYEQLNAHMLDMTTYKEADLCDSECMNDRLFISTVHKAKGLEFENVIIFEATEGVYPFFAKDTPEEIKESARLFYVAMSRAKKRLCLAHSRQVTGLSKTGRYYCIEKEATPFIRHITKYFHYK